MIPVMVSVVILLVSASFFVLCLIWIFFFNHGEEACLNCDRIYLIRLSNAYYTDLFCCRNCEVTWHAACDAVIEAKKESTCR